MNFLKESQIEHEFNIKNANSIQEQQEMQILLKDCKRRQNLSNITKKQILLKHHKKKHYFPQRTMEFLSKI